MDAKEKERIIRKLKRRKRKLKREESDYSLVNKRLKKLRMTIKRMKNR